ncbi:hypothetical protein ABGB17_22205 [Sphaerisporangium sp. B11E5]|uniref:hypothetical protein n=1 Tax=Sphaerisporangium sp. B11E5 TaxID=3153563 RepID=UPI00325D4644
MVLTIVPTATGTVGLRPDKFAVKVVPTAAAGGVAATATWYTCLVATPAEATSAAITFAVGTGSPTSTSTNTNTATTTPSPTPTSTTPTPRQTRTVFETVTSSPSNQVTRTPGGGAATGGGGDIGPDARVFLAVGSILVLGAGVGGLMMRRRRPQQG